MNTMTRKMIKYLHHVDIATKNNVKVIIFGLGVRIFSDLLLFGMYLLWPQMLLHSKIGYKLSFFPPPSQQCYYTAELSTLRSYTELSSQL